MDFILWCLLPAIGLTYGVVASDLLAPIRGLLMLRWARSVGALVGCAMCTGFWCGILIALNDNPWWSLSHHWIGRAVLGGLAVSGVLWQLQAAAAAVMSIAQAVDNLGKALIFGRHDPDGEVLEVHDGQEEGRGGAVRGERRDEPVRDEPVRDEPVRDEPRGGDPDAACGRRGTPGGSDV